MNDVDTFFAPLAYAIWQARFGTRQVYDQTSKQIWECAVRYNNEQDEAGEWQHNLKEVAVMLASEGPNSNFGVQSLGITHQDIADKAYSIYCDAGNSYPDNQSVTDGIWFEAQDILRRGERE